MTDVLAVSLSYAELRLAAEVGVQRQCQTYVRNGVLSAHQDERDNGWSYHIEGAAGEMALAKWLGIYWNGNLGNLNAKDVGGLQVRTRSNHAYELALHRDSKLADRYVLVTGAAPHFWLRGWITARAGMREDYWRQLRPNLRPAFFVPHSDLSPMETLPERRRQLAMMERQA